jgi:hypothetical protein
MENESGFILCKIIIGRSFAKIVKNKVELSSYTNENNFKSLKQPGYDSILFCPADSTGINKSAKYGSGTSKSYRYRIFLSANVLPMHYVTFSLVDQNVSTYSSKRICAECSDRDAIWFCQNCEEYLCEECYNSIHGETSNDKNLKHLFDHSKIHVSKIRNGKCIFDPDKDVEFYCKQCNISICSYCKVIGTHSKGEAAFHVLEDISTTLQRLNPDTSKVIKLMEEKKKKGVDAFNKIKNISAQLNQYINFELDSIIRNEYDPETNFINAKSIEILSEYMNTISNLFVIKDTISWLDKYFNERETYLKSIDNKAEFIWVWNHHNKMLQEIMNNKNFVNMEFKAPDIVILKNIKQTIIKVIHFRPEEMSTKEYNQDEISKSNKAKERKQVIDRDQKIDFISTFEIIF